VENVDEFDGSKMTTEEGEEEKDAELAKVR